VKTYPAGLTKWWYQRSQLLNFHDDLFWSRVWFVFFFFTNQSRYM